MNQYSTYIYSVQYLTITVCNLQLLRHPLHSSGHCVIVHHLPTSASALPKSTGFVGDAGVLECTKQRETYFLQTGDFRFETQKKVKSQKLLCQQGSNKSLPDPNGNNKDLSTLKIPQSRSLGWPCPPWGAHQDHCALAQIPSIAGFTLQHTVICRPGAQAKLQQEQWMKKWHFTTNNRHVATCWVDRRGLPGVSTPGAMADLVFVFLYTGGVGWGWVGGVGIIPNLCLATLHDLHLHLMLRCMILTCTWCYAAWSSLALDATLHDLHLHLMPRYMIFTCTWRYPTWVGGVGIIPNLSLATLHNLHLHLMLR